MLRSHTSRLLLALCLLAPASLRAQLHVAVRVSPVADLVHQLDCVAGAIRHCGRADYVRLWRERFLHDAADSAALRDWKALRARYAGGVEVEVSGRDAIGRTMRRVELGERWRLVALQARSWDDYHERLALLLLPPDRARVAAAMDRFRPRWQAWWDAEARDRLTGARDSLQAILARDEMRAMLGAVRHFYGATGPGADSLSLTLVARPGLVRGATNAQVVEGWSLQELLPGRSAAQEVGVTLHEVAHLLLSLAPDTTREATAAGLARLGFAGRATRSVLDEGLATAFGNGLVERMVRPTDRWSAYLARPLSFYNDSIIDAAGKALYPVLDSLLEARARLRDPATLTALHQALATGMGPRLTSPRTLFKDLWGFIDEGVANPRDVLQPLQESLRPDNYSVSIDSAGGMPPETLARDPWAGALVIAPAASLERLAAKGAFRPSEVAAMRRAAATGPVLYGARRANGARTWVIVARSAAEATPLIARLGALDRDADGVVPAPARVATTP